MKSVQGCFSVGLDWAYFVGLVLHKSIELPAEAFFRKRDDLKKSDRIPGQHKELLSLPVPLSQEAVH